MKRFAVLAMALGLMACGKAQPLVTNGDISKHLEGQGYSKILIRDSFSCGSMGKGRHFIATKASKVVTGQVCYIKNGTSVSYKVSELGTAKSASNDNRFHGITDPWKKN